MEIAMYIGGGILAATAFYFFRVRRRFNAAMNVLLAKYTFDRLDRNDKVKVKEEAKSLTLARGFELEGYQHEIERYGWYALAMKSLDLPSKLPENPNWYSVKNPSKALKRQDAMLFKASDLIKKHYSIDIKVN